MKLDFDRWWFEEGSGIVKTDAEDNEEHAHKVAKAAWAYAMSQIGCGEAIARVIDSDDFAAEVAWILNPLPPGTLLFEGPNVEVRGDAPLFGAASRSTAGLGGMEDEQ